MCESGPLMTAGERVFVVLFFVGVIVGMGALLWYGGAFG